MLNTELIGVANVQNKLMATPFDLANLFKFMLATTVRKSKKLSASQILRENDLAAGLELGTSKTIIKIDFT